MRKESNFRSISSRRKTDRERERVFSSSFRTDVRTRRGKAISLRIYARGETRVDAFAIVGVVMVVIIIVVVAAVVVVVVVVVATVVVVVMAVAGGASSPRAS